MNKSPYLEKTTITPKREKVDSEESTKTALSGGASNAFAYSKEACWEKSQTLTSENPIDFLQSKAYGFLGFRQGENSTFYKIANLRMRRLSHLQSTQNRRWDMVKTALDAVGVG